MIVLKGANISDPEKDVTSSKSVCASQTETCGTKKNLFFSTFNIQKSLNNEQELHSKETERDSNSCNREIKNHTSMTTHKLLAASNSQVKVTKKFKLFKSYHIYLSQKAQQK